MKPLEILPPDEKITVRRRSSIDQYKGFLNVVTKGGYTPIQFDSLDSITCERVNSYPIIISYGDDIGYHYADGECVYASDLYYKFDKETVELVPLECWHGGDGEFYERYSKSNNAFVNFSNSSLGSHSEKRLRVGLDYVLADEKLPAVD